jgi:hypothetical protein
MLIYEKGFIRHALSCLAVVAVGFAHSNCFASQRIENVVVRAVNGTPCFSIPLNRETRNGIPFYSILVSDVLSAGPNTRPERYWQADIIPYGNSISITPNDCFTYGKDLPSSEQLALKPLAPYRVYSVNLLAHPENSNLVGYSGEFCLIPGNNGDLTVKVLIRDGKPDAERYSVCTRD